MAQLNRCLGTGAVNLVGEVAQFAHNFGPQPQLFFKRQPAASDGSVGNGGHANSAFSHAHVIVAQLPTGAVARAHILESGRAYGAVAQCHRPDGDGRKQQRVGVFVVFIVHS